MPRLLLALLFVGHVAFATGCGDDDDGGIECVQDSNCDLDTNGQCLQAPSGRMWCAYPDATCPSGTRWADLDVGDGLAGMCVADGDGDAGLIDAALTDAAADGGMSVDASLLIDAGSADPGRIIEAGAAHTCLRFASGDVRCWGYGDSGRLGLGNTADIGDTELPTAVGLVDVGEFVTQIAVNGNTCALTNLGNVYCWGYGGQGRLGYGDQDNVGDTGPPSAKGAVNVGGTATQVGVGASHACALLMNGDVRCWGWGNRGRLGLGNINNIGDNEEPGTVGAISLGGPAKEIAVGDLHSCALLMNDDVRCWGIGQSGQLGYGETEDVGDNEAPSSKPAVSIVIGLDTVEHIAAGGDHTCALLSNQRVRCWGEAEDGQLGYGNQTDVGTSSSPSSAGDVDVGGDVVQITAGGDHTCALLNTGSVRCWGRANSGQLGYENITRIGDSEAPSTVGPVDLGGTARHVSAGGSHTCAVLLDNSVKCWGNGGFGRLGYGDENDVGGVDGDMPPANVSVE